jgi:hypothetical protein
MTSTDETIIDINELIEKEIWKEIPNFPKYLISSHGRIMNKRTKKILKPFITNQYLAIKLYNGIRFIHHYFHRLLALTFLHNPNSEEYIYVDHKDGIKTNNSLSNLRWVSPSMNNLNYQSKRNYKKIIQCSRKGIEIKIWNSEHSL